MTNKQINAAIHAALGNPKSCKTPKSCQACCCDECLYNKGLNYCNDLNAMHEAEKVLEKQQVREYQTYMYDMACEIDNTYGRWMPYSATARYRAEAFLRTLGKWEEA